MPEPEEKTKTIQSPLTPLAQLSALSPFDAELSTAQLAVERHCDTVSRFSPGQSENPPCFVKFVGQGISGRVCAVSHSERLEHSLVGGRAV